MNWFSIKVLFQENMPNIRFSLKIVRIYCFSWSYVTENYTSLGFGLLVSLLSWKTKKTANICICKASVVNFQIVYSSYVTDWRANHLTECG